MMLSELTEVPAAALPVADFKAHVRLGSGFADDGMQDGLAESYLRAALAAIEGRIGKALISRDFSCRLPRWRGPDCQPLPLAPVSAVTAVVLVAADGSESVCPSDRYRLVRDLQRPHLSAVGAALPSVPEGGAVRIDFVAGFGAGWGDLPADLRQAVLLLAAEYYETRHAGGMSSATASGAMPFGVMALIERWRSMRVMA